MKIKNITEWKSKISLNGLLKWSNIPIDYLNCMEEKNRVLQDKKRK